MSTYYYYCRDCQALFTWTCPHNRRHGTPGHVIRNAVVIYDSLIARGKELEEADEANVRDA